MPNQPAQRLSVKAYARRRGCTPKAVRNALGRYGIQRDDDGLIDVAALDASWPSELASENAAARGGPAGGPPWGDQEGDGGPSALVLARTRKEEALAGLRELELEEKRGNLLTIDYADTVLDRAFGIVRAKLLNLPGIAPRLVGLDSIAKIQETIQQEIDDMLRALSRAGEWDDEEDDDEDNPDGPDGEEDVDGAAG